jgi:hypothetical protein
MSAGIKKGIQMNPPMAAMSMAPAMEMKPGAFAQS